MRICLPTSRFKLIVMTSLLVIAGALCCARLWWHPSMKSFREGCQDAQQSKDWSRFETTAVQWAATFPEHGEPWLQLAESHRRKQNYQLALDCLNRIPRESPEAEPGMLELMELQFGALNRPEDGAETCERILASNPQSSVARERLIFFLAFTLQRTRMVHQIRLAVEAGNEPLEAYVYFFFADSLLFSNAVELNNRWLKGDPDSELYTVSDAVFRSYLLDLWVLLYARYAAKITLRAAEKKATVMERLLAKYPHNAELLAYNLRQHIQNGDTGRVVELLSHATVECEDDHRFWRFKGWVHAQRHQDAEAEKSYRKAITLHPLDWSTRALLAELLVQQQKRFDEVKALRELVARGNGLNRELRHAPNAKQVPHEVLIRLAEFARDCSEGQISEGLFRRLKEDSGS